MSEALLLREGEGIWEGRGRQGRGRGGRAGDVGEGTGREGTPNILLHPQFQFSRNMPAHDSVKYYTSFDIQAPLYLRTSQRYRNVCYYYYFLIHIY